MIITRATNKFKQIIFRLKRKLFPLPDYPKLISQIPSLKQAIDYANSKSTSTGVSQPDYYYLYNYVRLTQPKYVLECGTGKSTIVIAQAMLDNRLNNPTDARLQEMKLVSMEDKKDWYEHSKQNIPQEFNSFVEIHHSKLSFASYSLLSGVVYETIPKYPYDFMFIDGPDQSGGTGITKCDFDIIKYVSTSDHPVSAFIDNRKHTILACTLAFGQDKVTFYPNEALGYVAPVTKKDLVIADKISLRNSLFKNGGITLSPKPFLKTLPFNNKAS